MIREKSMRNNYLVEVRQIGWMIQRAERVFYPSKMVWEILSHQHEKKG